MRVTNKFTLSESEDLGDVSDHLLREAAEFEAFRNGRLQVRLVPRSGNVDSEANQ
jgi:hypothetical protein